MKIPSNMTQEETFQVVDKVIKQLSKGFAHGCKDEDDMYQEGWLIAIDFLEGDSYDEVRPLTSILRSHIRNRFLNMIRHSVRRSDPPCKACASGTYCTPSGPCEKYAKWQQRNNDKASLSKPPSFEDEDPPVYSDVFIEASISELDAMLKDNLNPRQRRTYLMAQDNEKDTLNSRRDLQQLIEDLTHGKI